MTKEYRIESDSLGEVKVPVAALYGAQTQRALENFAIGGMPMPARFICSLGLIKAAAARANQQLGEFDSTIADGIFAAAMAIAGGEYGNQFPVDVFQTGSATSSNMNANEVIARLASEQLGQQVDANDDVNCSQSSNDVIPTAIHVSAYLALEQTLLPALEGLQAAIAVREGELSQQIKTGRTHLMDALPISLAQELSGWRAQLELAQQRIGDSQSRLCRLAQGGTAIGTGVNADENFPVTDVNRMQLLAGVLVTTW
jgi:fumarate hydratase class II